MVTTSIGCPLPSSRHLSFTPPPQVPNVAVIVTDGRPQDRVAEVAAEAREKGIEIYAVGVARADMTSLRAMASPPFEDHVFLVESFDLIHQFGLQFQDKLCGETAGQEMTKHQYLIEWLVRCESVTSINRYKSIYLKSPQHQTSKNLK